MSEKSVAVILKENTILMEKIVIDGRAFYSLPGGTIEPGETPEQAVIRELTEECNLDVEVILPLSIVHILKNRTKYTFSFTAALSGNQTKTLFTKTVKSISKN